MSSSIKSRPSRHARTLADTSCLNIVPSDPLPRVDSGSDADCQSIAPIPGTRPLPAGISHGCVGATIDQSAWHPLRPVQAFVDDHGRPRNPRICFQVVRKASRPCWSKTLIKTVASNRPNEPSASKTSPVRMRCSRAAMAPELIGLPWSTSIPGL
jgi:hypothetical protein